MKIGILGGGQLGRMLLQAGVNYIAETYVLENDENCPSAHLCNHFIKGNIQDFDTVYHFGKNLDAITIEIESVNVDALEILEAEGVRVYPSPAALRIIKNKIYQKQFYKQNEIPTADFSVTQSNSDLLNNHLYFLPAVHKLAEGGYDGKGVQILNDFKDLEKGFDQPSVLEKLVAIHKEIAIIIAMNDKGETAIYPAAEMIFDHRLNLLDYQISPALLPKELTWKIEAIARRIVKELKSPGIFAVELFIDKNNEVLVNEVAPRPHNSGHHTIEANYCSQYDMLWRILLQLPLGNTAAIQPSAIVNIVGADGHTGEAIYNGLPEVLQMGNAWVHLYGKTQTKSGRKMGHVTIMSNEYNELTHKAKKIKQLLQVTAS
ncbi:5-(carboxyamino)imidazole ribonucleotide synthase [Parasediminibacterium sp. JCM 36343]|uniref:5-(carboxyamino)imidazole ribonucleotide synthase n=1 Tax=Parasediminibacterium sp. JCM 36343 TaxID=3374279 RepID=UPI003979FF86